MVVKNGLVGLSGEDEFRRTDIRIENGVIAAIGNDLSERYAGDDTIDASGCWVVPGGIDPHVHFYDPGYNEREDFAHGTAAAAGGGVTTIIDMPCTSNPPVTDSVNLRTKLEIVQPRAVIDFGFHGGVSRQLFDERYAEAMESIADTVMAFKVYAISGMEEVWGALDHWRFRCVLERANELDSIVLLHAEDAEYVNNATAYHRTVGSAPRQWHDARPELAEILAVQSAKRIVEEVGGNLHVVHVGVGEVAEMIGGVAKNGGAGTGAPGAAAPRATLTGETCPQYLAFSLEDFEKQGAVLKIAPPIKTADNPPLLWNALASGTLHYIASDHAPGTAAEKAPGSIWDNHAGIAGVQTILPYTFSEGFLSGRLSLSRYLQVMSENAAKRFRIFHRKGSIAVGKDADVVLLDRNETWTVRGSEFYSKGKLSPFEGWSFRGRVKRTLVRGREVYRDRDGIVADGGWGALLTPKKRTVTE